MKKQFIVEAQRLQKLAGINEARVIPSNSKLYTLTKYGLTGNNIQNIMNTIADTKQEYFTDIDSNDILYRGLRQTVNSSQVDNDIADSLLDMAEVEVDNDEEDIVDTITDYANMMTHFRIMDRFAPQLVKNLLDAGFTYDKTEDKWTIPNDRYLDDMNKPRYDDKTATSYGIIWDFWGVDYDTSDRESISDSLADAAREHADINEARIVPITRQKNFLNISLPEGWAEDPTDLRQDYGNGKIVIGYFVSSHSYDYHLFGESHTVIIYKLPSGKYMVESNEAYENLKESEIFDNIEDAKTYAIKEMNRIKDAESAPDEDNYYED
jgi:hypothetical protein